MTLDNKGFDWQEVSIIGNTKGPRIKKSIHLLKSSKSGKYNLATISDDVIKELNWEPGLELKLYRSGRMFMLKPVKGGDFVLKAPSHNGRVYRIQSTAFCTTVMSYTQKASIYDAWVDIGVLLFKPKEVEEEV